MPVPTGREIFESYLSQLDFESDDKPDATATDQELDEHFESYLQDTLASQYPVFILEQLTTEASEKYDVDAVRKLL